MKKPLIGDMGPEFEGAVYRQIDEDSRVLEVLERIDGRLATIEDAIERWDQKGVPPQDNS